MSASFENKYDSWNYFFFSPFNKISKYEGLPVNKPYFSFSWWMKSDPWFLMLFKFSVAKATLQSQMSVRSFVRLSVLKQNPSTAWNHHPSSFILHPSSFFIHPSFISWLLSFSACFLTYRSNCCFVYLQQNIENLKLLKIDKKLINHFLDASLHND